MSDTPLPGLTEAAGRLARGKVDASTLIEHCLVHADAPECRHAFIRRFDIQARAAAASADALRRAGVPAGPLSGLPISIKDLFPVAGHATTAGARILPDTPAPADCPAVARLRRAGAVLIGHTNMTEFAFSGVGLNPHHGTPANPAMARLDATPRIPGGSTSGGAVALAAGASLAALGSDTGGSLRIPAALQGLVGFKCTARLTPTEGSLPLSPTLDTVGGITTTARDAALLHAVLADRAMTATGPSDLGRPLEGRRLAVATRVMLDGLEPEVGQAFEAALSALSRAGARIDPLPLPIDDLLQLHPLGSFAAAEAWHWHRSRLERDGERYDPRVASRIRRGASMSAADYLELLRLRRLWIARMEAALRGYHAVLSPTVPMIAPPMQPLVDDDAHFFETNALLLRNPSVINLLDGCAISLPCHAAGTAPVGLMLWAGALCDETLLETALAVEHTLTATRT